MAGYGVANNNNETTNTQLNAELSDEDIKNTLVPIENEVSATVENLPFVPESNVNQMTPSITTNNTDVLSDADIKSTLVPMGADYQSELEEDVLNPTAPRGPDDDLKVGELQTGHRLYTKQYLENMFPNLDSRPFEFTDENVNELNKELLHSAKDELNTAWATGKEGLTGVKNLLRKLKRMDPEVDYSKEAPAGLRNKLVGMDTTEEKKDAINEYFGKEAAAGTDKWGNLTFINPDNGQKTIVDKPEFTMKDWIDLRDDAPLLAATILGAWKLRTAHWVYQMLGDTGIYMSGRSATEAVEEWTGRNKETYEDVSDRLWTEAFLVMGLNLAVGTGVWGINRMKNPIHTGVTPDSELAVKEMLRMNERRIDAGLPPVQLLASALNDNPMLARIEGILAKIPVSAQIYKVKQGAIDKMIADEVEFLIKDLNITGVARNAEVQRLSDVLSGADANDGFVEPLESALQIIHDFEHELSVGVPTATEKAISKFRELNSTSLKTLEDKMKNIRMTIAEGINSGITKMSEGLARAFVFGENLKDTFKNMARTLLVNVLSALIEIVARKGVELAIEKLITREKQKQAALSGASFFSSFAGAFGMKASGGAVSKGRPVIVGEQGAELFVPNSSGQITQAARGTNGGQTTVNFNINTLDASGFDELLVRNRGTITAIINSAVNERGSKNLI